MLSFPDNQLLRLQLAEAYAVSGDRDSFRKEKERILAEFSNNGSIFVKFALIHFYYLNEFEASLEMTHRGAQLGTLGGEFGYFDVIPQDTPGYQAALRTHTELRNRLADLYLESD